LKYIRIVQTRLLKKRHFKDEILWGIGILVGLLLIFKILRRLILGTTLISFSALLWALLLYLVVLFVIRFVEIKLRR
jgi:hypothetical protein